MNQLMRLNEVEMDIESTLFIFRSNLNFNHLNTQQKCYFETI